jgi:hypothetical protein
MNKKILSCIVVVFLLLTVRSFSQTVCNIGNESPVFTGSQSLPANNIFGVKYTVTSSGTLTGLSMNGLISGTSNVQMAVYNDVAGAPGTLIATSGISAITVGTFTLAVTPQLILPGDYYLMAVIDFSGSVISLNTGSTTTVYFTPNAFGSPFPISGSGFGLLPGSDVNTWMNIT